MKTIVLKFGGTSIGTIDRIKKVCKIIAFYKKKKNKVVVVSSAMSGVTNELVNKSKLIERIAETVKNNIIEGISDLRDESDRTGVRVVIELKKDVDANIILNQLYKNTLLQTTFNSNMLALNKGKPEQMNLKEILVAFIDFREEVITKRTIFDLNKARDKAHVLLGLVVANANIDEIIELIKSSKDSKEARQKLINKKWKLSEQHQNTL